MELCESFNAYQTNLSKRLFLEIRRMSLVHCEQAIVELRRLWFISQSIRARISCSVLQLTTMGLRTSLKKLGMLFGLFPLTIINWKPVRLACQGTESTCGWNVKLSTGSCVAKLAANFRTLMSFTRRQHLQIVCSQFIATAAQQAKIWRMDIGKLFFCFFYIQHACYQKKQIYFQEAF